MARAQHVEPIGKYKISSPSFNKMSSLGYDFYWIPVYIVVTFMFVFLSNSTLEKCTKNNIFNKFLRYKNTILFQIQEQKILWFSRVSSSKILTKYVKGFDTNKVDFIFLNECNNISETTRTSYSVILITPSTKRQSVLPSYGQWIETSLTEYDKNDAMWLSQIGHKKDSTLT